MLGEIKIIKRNKFVEKYHVHDINVGNCANLIISYVQLGLFNIVVSFNCATIPKTNKDVSYDKRLGECFSCCYGQFAACVKRFSQDEVRKVAREQRRRQRKTQVAYVPLT